MLRWMAGNWAGTAPGPPVAAGAGAAGLGGAAAPAPGAARAAVWFMGAGARATQPAVRIFTHADVVPKLGDLASVTTAVGTGDTFTAAGFDVRVYGGQHAVIHPDIPRIANLGYLLDGRVYHPGDSYDLPGDAEIDTLFVPVSAPWLKASETVDFIRAVRPRHAYALHDALLNDAYANLLNGLLTGMAGTGYRRLGAGESLSV